MKIVRLFAALAALATTVLLFAAPASAQATRTWVSGVGDDANPCSRTAPCMTFAGAFSKTAASGEINCLDPGPFGGLTITKAITISCEAGTAGVLVPGTSGFVIAAGTSDAVFLKGLDFDGAGPSGGALDGIKVQSAGTVMIDHCIIYGFGSTNGVDGNGIFVDSTNSVQVTIQDTLISNNANAGVDQADGKLQRDGVDQRQPDCHERLRHCCRRFGNDGQGQWIGERQYDHRQQPEWRYRQQFDGGQRYVDA